LTIEYYIYFIVHSKNQVRNNKKQMLSVNTWKHSQACSWETKKTLSLSSRYSQKLTRQWKTKKRKKQENLKIRTKVHQHWFSSRCSSRKHKTIFCW